MINGYESAAIVSFTGSLVFISPLAERLKENPSLTDPTNIALGGIGAVLLCATMALLLAGSRRRA